MEIKVLIAVPVLNLWARYTKPMIKSVKSKYPYDILIVDNASTDGTREHALEMNNEEAYKEKITVKRNEINKGCAGGWNDGLEYGMQQGYTHILIPNNDILLSPFTVDKLVEFLNEHPDIALASAVDVAGEIPVAEDILHEDHAVNHKDFSFAPHPNFSCFMVRSNFVDEIGWVDEGFFPAYFEDNDIHRRVKLAKGENGAVATTAAVFYHFGSRTQNESGDKPVVPGSLFEQNRQYFITKWGGAPTQETFATPFNDPNNNWKYAKRN